MVTIRKFHTIQPATKPDPIVRPELPALQVYALSWIPAETKIIVEVCGEEGNVDEAIAILSAYYAA